VPKAVHPVTATFNAPTCLFEGSFLFLYGDQKHFKEPPLLIYKRRPPPPHLNNNTSREKEHHTRASFQRA
jgi:hypothetical protein